MCSLDQIILSCGTYLVGLRLAKTNTKQLGTSEENKSNELVMSFGS